MEGLAFHFSRRMEDIPSSKTRSEGPEPTWWVVPEDQETAPP